VDRSENPHVIRVFARTDIRAAGGAPLDEAAAGAISGAADDIGLCSTSNEIHDLGLLGGRVQLDYDDQAGHFWASAEHESPSPLGDQEIELLKDRTNGDWCDGGAAAFFDYLGGHLGFDLWVSWRDPLLVLQSQRKGWRFVPWSKLARACWRGDLQAPRAAQDAGEDPDARPEGLPILHGAIVRGHVPVAQLLLERGADVYAGDQLEVRRTALRSCATCHRQGEGTLRIARMLLERGADPSGGTDDPLAVARRRKWDRMVELLEEFAGDAGGGRVASGTELRAGDRVRIGRGFFAGTVGVIEHPVIARGANSAKVRIKLASRDMTFDVPCNALWPLGAPDRPRPPE
jgi:hypothetical protein